jgi:undecaprenyl-diphosphatase
MSLYHALLLGLVQGATEFLPISSSGHLALLEIYWELPFSPSVLQHFDIVLHFGSLLAILLYFGGIWLQLLRHPLTPQENARSPLLFLLVIGTLPAAIAGFFGEEWFVQQGRTPLALGIGFLLTGTVLLFSSVRALQPAGGRSLGWQHALGMGIGQAFALFPSISRSGMTIASGRFLGLDAPRATEVSFLLSAPALAGAITLTFFTGGSHLAAIGWPQAIVGFVASFVSSIATIHLFLAAIRRYGLWMWAIYLFVLGLFLIGDDLLPALREITGA